MADRYSCRKERKNTLSHTHYNSHSSSNNPSFSSMLLDTIYRSIDQAEEEINIYREMAEDTNVRAALIKSEEEMANNYQRACMIEKWMEKKVTEKIAVRRKSAVDDLYVKKPRKDPQNSSTSSSDSSCRGSGGGGFSSFSEGESLSGERRNPVQIGASEKFGKKCNGSNLSTRFVHQSTGSLDGFFSSSKTELLLDERTKPTQIKGSQKIGNVSRFSSSSGLPSKNSEVSEFSSHFVPMSNFSSQFIHQFSGPPITSVNMSYGGVPVFNNNRNSIDIPAYNQYDMGYYKNDRDNPGFGDQLEQKSRARKIHGDLKKVKKPISPGGKLAAFFNSLFTTRNLKKPKIRRGDDSPTLKSTTTTTNQSTSSSASPYSISCLTKMTSSRPKSSIAKRSVRFSPVSVIVDDDSHKSLNNNINIIKTAIDDELIMNYHKENDELRKTHVAFDQDYDEEDDTEFDAASCASSDLFELDNIFAIGMDDERYREELPVYETTHIHNKNQPIANFVFPRIQT